jgi:hypothetical protein
MNINIKASVAGFILILLTIIFALKVGLEKGLPFIIIIVPATIGFVSLLLASRYSKSLKELLSDVKDSELDEISNQWRIALVKNKKEYVYMMLSLLILPFLFLYISNKYFCNLSEGKSIAFSLFFLFITFGLIHIIAGNFISAFYNFGDRYFPYNYIPLNTPKRSRFFGIICLLIACIVGLGIFL